MMTLTKEKRRWKAAIMALLIVVLSVTSVTLQQIVRSKTPQDVFSFSSIAPSLMMWLMFWTMFVVAESPFKAAARSAIFDEDQTGSVWLLIALSALVIFYVALALTPSHYALGLRALGSDQQPLLFAAQVARADEYYIMTPLFQTAVRGGHAVFNQISPYRESMKGFWALPIADWALVFRPQLWGFWVLPPAYAYSLYFAILWTSFIAGYAILLVQLGAERRIAVLGATCLLFSGFVQVWWTSNAPTFSFAPWPLIVFLLRIKPLLKLPLLFWICALWIFSFAYPPFIISGAFTLGVLLLAFRRDALSPANLMLACCALIGLGLCIFWYYGDLIEIMRATIYPGSRISSGGGVEAFKLVSHVLPFFPTMNFAPLYEANACEVQVVSTLLPLTFLCLADYRVLGDTLRRNRLNWSIVGIGLAALLAWIFLPVPASVGRFLLWTHVPPDRMLWGLGLLLTLSITLLVSQCPFRLSPLRVCAFVAVMLGGWLISKAGFTSIWGSLDISLVRALLQSTFEMLAAIAFVMTASLAKKYKAERFTLNRIFMLSAAYTGLLTFGTFNPVQQAFPIFDIPDTAFLQAVRREAATSPNGWAVVPGGGGAIFSGAGIPAIDHTLTAPQLGFFRRFFPDLPEAEFNEIFNRYAYIVPVEDLPRPVLHQQDMILVPASVFRAKAPEGPRFGR